MIGDTKYLFMGIDPGNGYVKGVAYLPREGTMYTPIKISFPSYVRKGDLSLFSGNEALYPRLLELKSKTGESFVISPDGAGLFPYPWVCQTKQWD